MSRFDSSLSVSVYCGVAQARQSLSRIGELLTPANAAAGELPHACFRNLQAFLLGVLLRAALLFGVYIRAPDFWKLPCQRAVRSDKRDNEVWRGTPKPKPSQPQIPEPPGLLTLGWKSGPEESVPGSRPLGPISGALGHCFTYFWGPSRVGPGRAGLSLEPAPKSQEKAQQRYRSADTKILRDIPGVVYH